MVLFLTSNIGGIKNIEELTLLLMYLTSWDEKGFIRDKNDEIKEEKVKTCCRTTIDCY